MPYSEQNYQPSAEQKEALSEPNTEQIKQLAEKNNWQYVGEGFDNIVYADSEKTSAFRLPKKIEGVTMIQRDTDVLPTLPTQEGIILPIPVVKNQDGVIYGEYPFVSGKKYEELAQQEQSGLLLQLTHFLHRLHTRSHSTLEHVPVINCREHFSLIWERVQKELKDILNEKQMDYAKKLFSSYLEQYKDTPSALIHGDISFDHLYYDNGQLSIIDWNDMQYTDPAYEFHHLLRQLPTSGEGLLRAQYNTGSDESFWERAIAYKYIDTFDALLSFVENNNTEHIKNFLDRIDADMQDAVQS